MKRMIDLLLAITMLIALAPLFAVIMVLVRLTSEGPIFYWSIRIGRSNRSFMMPKFRSMRMDTPIVPTDQLVNPDEWLTPIGPFLRTTSLDELPQLWSILRGHMSFVGPRPALKNQTDLIKMRTLSGVNELIPGLTGLAQINGRDELQLLEKVRLDTEYKKQRSTRLDLWILSVTILKVIGRCNVSH